MDNQVRELVLHPIGFVRSPYRNRYDAPHQPGGFGETAEAIVELVPDMNFEQALEDLNGMEKIWLVTWFDRNDTWKPKVQVPRGERKKRGLFSTRSPHRPNPIGLTLVDLLEVNGRTLRVANIDFLDGTPVLDIKPYLPHLEAFPEAKSGWIEEAEDEHESQRRTIEWTSLAGIQTEFLKHEFGIDLAIHVERYLKHGAEPHPYRRISETEEGERVIAVRSWRVVFSVERDAVHILRVESGYAANALLESNEPLHDEAAHKAFHKRNWSS